MLRLNAHGSAISAGSDDLCWVFATSHANTQSSLNHRNQNCTTLDFLVSKSLPLPVSSTSCFAAAASRCAWTKRGSARLSGGRSGVRWPGPRHFGPPKAEKCGETLRRSNLSTPDLAFWISASSAALCASGLFDYPHAPRKASGRTRRYELHCSDPKQWCRSGRRLHQKNTWDMLRYRISQIDMCNHLPFKNLHLYSFLARENPGIV